MTHRDHEEDYVFAFVVHNRKGHWPDEAKWRRAPARGEIRKPPWRIGNHPLSLKEFRREHDGRWICYARISHTNAIIRVARLKICAEDERAYFQVRPDKMPREKHIEASKQWQRGEPKGM